MKTIAFTGHRPEHVGGYDENNVIARYVKDELTKQIVLAIENGYRRFVFGGALGVDTWAGEIVADLMEWYAVHDDIKIYLELYSPFSGQENNWNEESKIRYYNLMARCDKVVEVCEPGYAPWKFLKRDDSMIDTCDMLIAVWNGAEKGGTAHTVKYAMKVNKPMTRINPEDAV